MRICSVSYIWIESSEELVSAQYLISLLHWPSLRLIFLLSSIKEIVFCRFYFDFSMTYIGAGMICSHLVNLSLLLGAVLSWGIMWPLISGLKGEWFPKTLPESTMKSLNGYKVWDGQIQL